MINYPINPGSLWLPFYLLKVWDVLQLKNWTFQEENGDKAPVRIIRSKKGYCDCTPCSSLFKPLFSLIISFLKPHYLSPATVFLPKSFSISSSLSHKASFWSEDCRDGPLLRNLMAEPRTAPSREKENTENKDKSLSVSYIMQTVLILPAFK